jgi:Fe-S-cluster containining protein
MPFKSVKPSDIFTCKKCGDCCKGYGGTYVTDKDIEKIAGYIHTDPINFISDYCEKSGGRPILGQGSDGYCIFWDKICTIHPVKPKMCREWPFIHAVLADVENWHIMAGFCPGMREDLPDKVILECVRREIKKN